MRFVGGVSKTVHQIKTDSTDVPSSDYWGTCRKVLPDPSLLPRRPLARSLHPLLHAKKRGYKIRVDFGTEKVLGRK